jgi:homocysteine S-methyltransferase
VAAVLVHAGADVVGVNCCDGPQVVLDVATAMLTQAPLVSALPNAGQPRRIDARTIYMATPEYFGIYARRFMKAGVRLVGGCRGTGTDHIRAMAAAARMMSGGQVPIESAVKVAPRPGTSVQAAKDPVPFAERSRFAAKIDRVWRERLGGGTTARAPKDRSEFVVSVEVNPAHGLDVARPAEVAAMLVAGGVDVVNIADGPRAVLRMSNTALGKHLMDTLGIEVLLHVCCRDRNLLGLQMDLLGDHVLGYRNLVIITGDPPKLGDFPKATAVFDVDSIGLLRLADGLNRGIDPTGKGIDGRTSFSLACGAEPAALDHKREMARLEKKIEAGAELIMTQPVYDADVVEKFLDEVKRFRIPVLLGVCPLASARNAEFLHHEVPGMSIPESIRERMKRAAPGPRLRPKAWPSHANC